MKDPFGKDLSVGDIILCVIYDYKGPIFIVAEILMLSDETIDSNETRGILRNRVIKSHSTNYLPDYIFSTYNTSVLLLKSKEIS